MVFSWLLHEQFPWGRLPLLHGLYLLYIFGNSWLSSHVWEGCVQALGCDGSWSGHWPCNGAVTFRWQCGTWGGGRRDAVLENFRALKWCYEIINLYLYLMGLVLRGGSKILQRRIPVSRWKTEDRLKSLPSILKKLTIFSYTVHFLNLSF